MTRKISIFVIVFALLLVSCRSVETVYVEPQPIDLEPSIQLLFDARPDDSKLEIIEKPETVYEILDNSNAYLMAWNNWKVYSASLENYLRGLSGQT